MLRSGLRANLSHALLFYGQVDLGKSTTLAQGMLRLLSPAAYTYNMQKRLGLSEQGLTSQARSQGGCEGSQSVQNGPQFQTFFVWHYLEWNSIRS